MNPEKREAYDYTMTDLNTLLGCPQCRARELLDAVSERPDCYSKGQSRACLEALLHPHECNNEIVSHNRI
jgi:hypothetical protein